MEMFNLHIRPTTVHPVLLVAFVFYHVSFVYRDNFLVLDIFFEALNYEKIEQKKAYDVAGLLGGAPAGLLYIRNNTQQAVRS